MKTELLTLLFDYLNSHAAYALLRNFEGLPERYDSRDIDIAIVRKDYRKHRKELVALIEQAGWKMLTYQNSYRLATWVCARIDGNGKAELVQLDFFFNTSLYGLMLLDQKKIMEHRRFNGKFYHVAPAGEFLDKYLYLRAVGADYPEKYSRQRARVENDAAVAEEIKSTFGCRSLSECDRDGRATLLRRLIIRNFAKYGLQTVGNVLRFAYSHLRNYACSDTGFSIGFTGPDGSGKTTVIDLLIENFGDVFRKAHAYYHFRPMLFGNLGEVAHKAGVKKEVDRNYSQPHRGGKTGTLSSLLRLFYYSADYIAGYFLRIKPHTRITRLVLFDRYFTDIICDSRRSRICLPAGFLYHFGKFLIPSLDYNVLLTAPTDTILQRKRELDREGIEAINRKIDFLADKKGYYKILNEGTPQEAVTKILNIVFEEQHQKNLKRLR
ncbi:MAG: hypothetical protein ACI3X6_08135 [Alloprevotella sp.]